MTLRRQLPVSSPLPAPALLSAAAAALRPRPDHAARLLCSLVDRLGAADGVLCGSGTQALQLAISTALDHRGDRTAPVALPAFTCYDVAAAAVGAGARVALYDVDPRTLAPDAASLERVLAAGARVIVVAWSFGHPPPWDDVLAAADRHGAMVIEDAAQGHGSAWNGRPAGSFGAMSVLSFGRGKGWTGGRGGALLVHDPALAVPSLGAGGLGAEAENVATALAQWALGRPAIYAVPAS
ncbi:MAG TPA: aminotransferase class I/II-fold pyridoxal phosphate-dependent enzyme, partial [Longimicrobium sp.]|nr:aminotransferase class I/II-fold pyridoxal phosphate-dependent enzyme [Longimicrobium sp.]